MKIFLIGPMGSGKSTIGKLLSKEISLKLYDTDKMIETSLKKNINEIFNDHGEIFFRQKEHKTLIDTKNIDSGIISTGGGIIENIENRNFLSEERHVFFLNSSVERQYERTKKSQKRPLLNISDPKKVLSELYEKRISFYRMVSNQELDMNKLHEKEVIDEIIKNISNEKNKH